MEIHSLQETNSIKYALPASPFYVELQKRVNQYFVDRNIDRYANAQMYTRTIILFVAWISLYLMMLSNAFTGLVFSGIQISFHIIMFIMSVAIAHDGSHNAYHRENRINKWVNKVFDLVGINTYFWEYNHIKSHHAAPNVPNYDSAIDSFTFFRFHPKAEWHRFHRYQHLYIFIIYAVSTLFKLLYLDFFSLRRKKIGFTEIENHPTKEIVYLVLTRVFVFAYTLIIPLLFIQLPAFQIISGFLVGHMISGIILGIVFQTTHLSERTTFPELDKNGMINNSFDQHILETTADFSIDNPLITFIAGGLNIHVVHHLFPNICQIHLPALAQITKQTAVEFNVPYKIYPSAMSALKSHLRLLKELGKPLNTSLAT